jgi:type IV pilus assembly protein PilN
METIHKKNGRLHIYVRQDKYKGELKSHNWVGRTYINGKQKVSSSGTTNLEEAIPILEKWFDDLQSQKNEPKSEIDQILDPKIDEKQVSSSPSLLETQSIETNDSKPEVETIQNPQKGRNNWNVRKIKKNKIF